MVKHTILWFQVYVKKPWGGKDGMFDSSLVEQGLFVWWITAQAGGGTSILMTYEATFDVKVSSLSSV